MARNDVFVDEVLCWVDVDSTAFITIGTAVDDSGILGDGQ